MFSEMILARFGEITITSGEILLCRCIFSDLSEASHLLEDERAVYQSQNVWTSLRPKGFREWILSL